MASGTSLLLSLFCLFAYCFFPGKATINITTVPSSQYIITQEGQRNVSLFCKVTLDNITLITTWGIKRPTDRNILWTSFDSSGYLISPPTLAEKIRVTGLSVVNNTILQTHSNLTILTFTDEFNEANFVCTANRSTTSDQHWMFTLGYPGLS